MIKTMAVKITKKNYPMVVACLPGGFACINPENVFGNYLIINKKSIRQIKGERSPIFTISNSWMSKRRMLKMYDFVGKETKGEFVELRQN